MVKQQIVRWCNVLLLVFCLSFPLIPFPPYQAQGHASIRVPLANEQWVPSPKGIQLSWQIPSPPDQAQAASTAAAALQQLPLVRYGGYQLPMQMQAVILNDATAFAVSLQSNESYAWNGTIAVATPLTPLVVAGTVGYAPLAEATPTLPGTPVFLLREGRIRGQRIGVVAFSPLYQVGGVTKLTYRLQAEMSGAQLLDAQDLTRLMTRSLAEHIIYSSNGAPLPKILQIPAPNPDNPAAFQNAVKILVSHSGIQKLLGGALLQAGLHAGSELAKLHLTGKGHTIALEIRDTDGLLDDRSEVRFYAPPQLDSMNVGDRWNLTDTYWLTLEASTGTQMASRNADPGDAPTRIVGYEQGIWEENTMYEPTMAGDDGDHWFALKLSVEARNPSLAIISDTHVITFNNHLQLASSAEEPSVIRLTGSARSVAGHNLRVSAGGASQDFIWTNTSYYQTWQNTFTTTAHSQAINVSLVPVSRTSELRLDKIYWRQPVYLTFAGQGATFSSVEGIWRYVLANVPLDGTLYDISNPLQPLIINMAWATSLMIQDGPQTHEYLLAGQGTVYTPDVIAHTPSKLTNITGADEIYIAPATLHPALTPLVEHRRKQGYKVAVVDVQDAYDAWAYGQISPEAIRSLLRYAVATWQPAPIAAVLVGDSTVDPHDYYGSHNPNILPPYLADVDPWIREAACENCYAQLDDDSPLAGITDKDFLIDIWVGRFSVQTPNQLKVVVDKIINYETVQSQDPRPRHSLYVADNYISPDGIPDTAGDFAFFQDLAVVGNPDKGLPPMQPPTFPAVRLYYDPRPGGVTDPWREPDAEQARLRVIEEFKQGPSLIVYNGHSNHYQWASTIYNLPNPFLFGTNDIYELHNISRLGIVLEMTCMTAQFVNVSASGTTIDERFQRHEDGGAVAVWGSAGLTVAYGHEPMLRGFHDKLWSLPLGTARLGELTAAGYFNLFTQSECCQATGKVYLLLGDPLTPAYVMAPIPTFLPAIRR